MSAVYFFAATFFLFGIPFGLWEKVLIFMFFKRNPSAVRGLLSRVSVLCNGKNGLRIPAFYQLNLPGKYALLMQLCGARGNIFLPLHWIGIAVFGIVEQYFSDASAASAAEHSGNFAVFSDRRGIQIGGDNTDRDICRF